jgi:hypothetical protein
LSRLEMTGQFFNAPRRARIEREKMGDEARDPRDLSAAANICDLAESCLGEALEDDGALAHGNVASEAKARLVYPGDCTIEMSEGLRTSG